MSKEVVVVIGPGLMGQAIGRRVSVGKRSSSQPKIKGSPDFFTDDVQVEAFFQQKEPGRVGAGRVSELFAHMEFYAGWPCASSATDTARKTFAEGQ